MIDFNTLKCHWLLPQPIAILPVSFIYSMHIVLDISHNAGQHTNIC